MGRSDNGVSWLHRLASLVAVMTFLLFMTGLLALETGSDIFALHPTGRTLAVDPPNQYVHICIVLAVIVSVLTVMCTFLLMKSRSSRYLKVLGNITVAVLLAMALIVMSPARGLFSAAGPFAYLFGIQVLFCLTVCLALFTRTDWRWDETKTPDLAAPSIRQILVFTTGAVFLQPFLGEGFRRGNLGIAPHLILGIAVTGCSLWVLEMALTKYSHLRAFKISVIFLAELVGLQLFLGIISYSMVLNARAVPDSQPGLVVINVTHASIGALVLAASLFVTFQAFKYFAPAQSRKSSAILNNNRAASPQQD